MVRQDDQQTRNNQPKKTSVHQWKLIAIVGPTASGKTTLSVSAAHLLGGEIVNCDSIQVYRCLEAGTAKPTAEQRKSIPHHLYDLIDPHEYYSAGRYMLEARRVCREIAARGKIPLVVGGTGLYLRALLEGIFEGPGRSKEIRERIDLIAHRKGVDYLYRLLERKDPGAARRIQPNDQIRVVRALEIYWLSGRPISQLLERRKPLSGFSILRAGLNLPRPVLYTRINYRVQEMFRSGLVEEVERLLKGGYSPQSKGFEALGYGHTAAFLQGELSLENAIALTCRDTRRYAKRQMTWFHREKDIQWIPYAGEDSAALERLLKLAKEKLQL